MVDITKLFNGNANGNGKPDDFDVEKVLASLSTVSSRHMHSRGSPDSLFARLQTEKVALLSGADFWHTPGFPEKGVPSVRMSDGPNGVRGIK